MVSGHCNGGGGVPKGQICLVLLGNAVQWMWGACARRFAALQQHIDELTQEKYDLMRGIAAQQRMAEDLGAENQRMTEDFNRQARGLHPPAYPL